jgi:hemolysin activation/secretion protein
VLNLARSGRSASAGWEAAGNNTSSLRFEYTEPWVSGLPFSSTVSFEHTARDTFFAKTSLAVSAKVPVWRGLSGQVGASLEKTLDTDGSRSRATRTAWLAGAELFLGEPSWLSRNTLLTSLEFSRGRRKLVHLNQSGGDEDSESRAFSTLEGAALIQGRVRGSQLVVLDASVSAVMEGRGLIAGDELFPLGGKNTLRGYSERQFLAETVGSLQCEYGLAVGGEGGKAFVFLDCGYASTLAASTAERFHYGYGIGLSVPSLLGLAGIDLGIPAGESFNSAKIHVGLEGRF